MEKDNKTMKSQNLKDKSKRCTNKSIIIGGAIAGVIVVALYVLFFYAMLCICPNNMEETKNMTLKSQLGDSFGMIGALFTGLALVGVIVAAIQQNSIIRLHRDEITNAKKKAFEDSYFLLLDKLRGERDFFYYEHKKGLKGMQEVQEKMKADSGAGNYKKILENSSIGCYITLLFLICEKVESDVCFKENDKENKEEKEYYMSFIRNQLTRVECSVLLYYGISVH